MRNLYEDRNDGKETVKKKKNNDKRRKKSNEGLNKGKRYSKSRPPQVSDINIIMLSYNNQELTIKLNINLTLFVSMIIIIIVLLIKLMV